MAYALKQIYEALAALDNGADMLADLQDEIGRLRTESGDYRTANKQLLAQLGIDDPNKAPETLAGIKATLDAIKASGQAPDTVGTQLSSLSQQIKDLTAKYTESEEKAAAERTKRIQTAINSQLVSALTEGKAIKPDVFSNLLAANVIAKDDDSLVYKNGDKEISVADGVKSWLTENAWAVKNDSNPGAGSGAPGGGASGSIKPTTLAEAINAQLSSK